MGETTTKPGVAPTGMVAPRDGIGTLAATVDGAVAGSWTGGGALGGAGALADGGAAVGVELRPVNVVQA